MMYSSRFLGVIRITLQPDLAIRSSRHSFRFWDISLVPVQKQNICLFISLPPPRSSRTRLVLLCLLEVLRERFCFIISGEEYISLL